MKVPSNLFNSQDYYNRINKKVSNVTNIPLIVIICVIIIFFIVISNLFSSSPTNSTVSPYDIGSTSSVSESSGQSFLGTILVTGIVLTMLIFGLKYLFNIDIYTELKNIYTNHPEIDLNIDTHQKKHIPKKQHHHGHKNKHHKDKKHKIDYPVLSSPEVFHISDNNYSYDDATSVCKAFNSRLATYDEVEQAYNSGGEWCSYGWSQKGLALFPTQKDTYNKLEKIKGYKNVCGRPGVNGGYIKDKHMKFGANCYGIKPEINNIEEELMKQYKVYPLSKHQKKIDHRAQHYKNKLNKILITPFNKKKWTK